MSQYGASITPAFDDAVVVRRYRSDVEFVAICVGGVTLSVSVYQAACIRNEIAAALRHPLELEEVDR
jgi:hypothetical protein